MQTYIHSKTHAKVFETPLIICTEIFMEKVLIIESQ